MSGAAQRATWSRPAFHPPGEWAPFSAELSQRLAPRNRNLLKSLEKEIDPEIRAQGVLNLGNILIEQGDPHGALQLFQILQNPGPGLRYPSWAQDQARRRSDALLGSGTLGVQFEITTPRVFHEISNPKALALMVGAHHAYRALRNSVIWLPGGGAAAGLGVAGEGLFFSAGARLLGLGASQSFMEDWGSMTLRFGMMRGAGALAGTVSRGKFPKGLLAEASQLGGLYTALQLERRLGLGMAQEGSLSATALTTFFQFKIAGALSGSAGRMPSESTPRPALRSNTELNGRAAINGMLPVPAWPSPSRPHAISYPRPLMMEGTQGSGWGPRIRAWGEKLKPRREDGATPDLPTASNLRKTMFFGIGASALGHGILLYTWENHRPKKAIFIDEKREELKKALVTEAWQALSQGQRKAGLGYFFIYAENLTSSHLQPGALDANLEAWLKSMIPNRARLESEPDPELKIQRLLGALHLDFFHRYGRDFPHLTHFLSEKKGNCVAQTKLILGAFDHLKIEWPAGQELAVQVFKNHVQPVRLWRSPNGEISQVQSLVTGKKLPHLVAPVYHPDIFYVGFLKKQGLIPPKDFEDLLVAEAQPEHIKTDGFAIPGYDPEQSDVEFPYSEAIFEDSGVDEAILPAPDFSASQPSWENSKKAPSPVMAGDLALLLFEDKPGMNEFPWDYSYRPEGMFFRTSAQRDKFLAIRAPEEYPEFQASLIRMALGRGQGEPGFEALRNAISHPYRNLLGMNPAELQAIENFRERYNIRHVLHNVPFHLSPDWEKLGGEAQVEKILQGLPQWQEIQSKEKAWLKAVAERPEEFILFLNQFKTFAGRRAARSLFHQIYLLHLHDRQEPPPGIVKLLLDPKRVGVEEDPARQSGFHPIPTDLIWLEISDPKMPKPDDPGRDGPANPPAEPPPPTAIRISPQLMMDLILEYGNFHPELAERWDERVDSAYRELNRTGELDERFWDFLQAVINKKTPYDPDRPLAEEIKIQEQAFADSSPYFSKAPPQRAGIAQ